MSAIDVEAASGGVIWRSIVSSETRIVKMDGRHKYIQWLLAEWDKQPRRSLLNFSDDLLAAVREPAPDSALNGHHVLGSSCGWLATANDRGQIYIVNPGTGEQHALPHMDTMGVFLPCTRGCFFLMQIDRFLTARFGSGPPFKDNCWGPDGRGTYTLLANQMRASFYRKVVLSASPRPSSYTAMLILHRNFGAPAFATSEDPAWRLAPSHDGVEDAILHDGRFYSISYSGVVESWEPDAKSGLFTSTAVGPRLAVKDSFSSCRKYLAAAPGGRLMVVLKYPETFKVNVLGDDGQWKEISDSILAAMHDKSLAQYKRRSYAYVEVDIGYDEGEPYLMVDEDDVEYENIRLLKEERNK